MFETGQGRLLHYCDNCALTAWPITEYQRQRDIHEWGRRYIK